MVDDPRIVRETVTIRMEGNRARDGMVSATVLGEALIGLTSLVDELGKVGEWRDHGAPDLIVTGTSEGSFLLEIDFQALGEWWAATREILNSPDAQAIVNLLAFTGFFGTVINVLRRKGRRTITETRVVDDHQVELELDGQDVITVDPDVAQAVSSPKVQWAAKAALAPLNHQGIDSMTINASTINITVLAKEAAAIPEPEAKQLDDKVFTFEEWVRFNRPDFGGSRWGVETHGGGFVAEIEDAEFISLVDQGSVTLGKYSEFRVCVRVEPYRTAGGQVRNKRYITKILDRRDGANDDDAASLFDDERSNS